MYQKYGKIIFGFIIIFSVVSLSNSIIGEYQIFNRVELFTQIILNSISDIFDLEHLNHRDLITFWCMTPDNPTVYQPVYQYDKQIREKLDFSKPFGFFVHGWTDYGNRTWLIEIVRDYVRYTDSNMCAVNWGRLATTEYTIMVKNTRFVANVLSEFIAFLQTNGLRLADVTLVGHSAGAQISGMVGMILKGEIGRIIGLDTAGVLFAQKNINYQLKVRRLVKRDAKFVQCINTDYTGLGAHYNCGHQNYYPNNGRNPQPGCNVPFFENGMAYSSTVCSHYKAVEYFHSSLNPANKFTGTQCDTYENWVNGNCAGNPTDNMGIYAKKENALGKLYLQTTIWPPYTTNVTYAIY